MYRVTGKPKPPLGIRIGNENYNTQRSTIRSLSNINGYECIQLNGQRTWKRLNDDLDGMNVREPSLDCEIFVGKIPFDVFEDELIPLLSQAGTLHELRLLIQFNGNNRGYAFARFTTIEEAKKAIEMFDNYEIRYNRKLGLMFAIQNTTLYLRNIPKHVSTEEIVKLIRQNTKGIVTVNIFGGFSKKSVTITYESHRDATLARKQIISDAILEWNTNLCIDINGPPSSLSDNENGFLSSSYSESLSSTDNYNDVPSLSKNRHNESDFSTSFYSEPLSSINNYNDVPSLLKNRRNESGFWTSYYSEPLSSTNNYNNTPSFSETRRYESGFSTSFYSEPFSSTNSYNNAPSLSENRRNESGFSTSFYSEPFSSTNSYNNAPSLSENRGKESGFSTSFYSEPFSSTNNYNNAPSLSENRRNERGFSTSFYSEPFSSTNSYNNAPSLSENRRNESGFSTSFYSEPFSSTNNYNDMPSLSENRRDKSGFSTSFYSNPLSSTND